MCSYELDGVGPVENFVSPQCSVSVRLIHYSESGILRLSVSLRRWLIGWFFVVRHVRDCS